jgi:hypothetical protein
MPWYRLPKSGIAMFFEDQQPHLAEIPDPALPAAEPESAAPEEAGPKPAPHSTPTKAVIKSK